MVLSCRSKILDPAEQERKLSRSDLFDDVRFTVPDETQKTLGGLGCVLRTTPIGFVIGTEANKAGGAFVPVRIPRTAFKLRVVLEAHASRFWNYTNIASFRDRFVYYFSNRAGQLGASSPEISRPERSYESDTEYLVGDVVQNAAGKFLAIRSGTHPAPTGTDTDANWFALGEHSYATEMDYVKLRFPAFSFQPRLAMEAIDSIRAIDQDGTAVDLDVPAHSRGRPILIDASRLPAGQYQLIMAGRDSGDNPIEHSERIYLDPELPKQQVAAIVELFHLPGEDLGDYRFYEDTTGFELRSPTYLIRLLNRHTFWRYQFRVPPEDDLGDLEKVNGHFLTKKVMPLTRDYQQVKLGGGELLPNASADRIVPEDDRVFSEVHVHVTPKSET